MKSNVGSTDKVLRILAVILILFLFFNHLINGTLAIVLMVVGGIFALTSIVGFCPLYAIFGIQSNKIPDK
ncbi:MAG: DUF2892 domain-containing protein [Bacteroidota bacterium]